MRQTSVAAQSVRRIHRWLYEVGASAIETTFDQEGEPTGVFFSLGFVGDEILKFRIVVHVPEHVSDRHRAENVIWFRTSRLIESLARLSMSDFCDTRTSFLPWLIANGRTLAEQFEERIQEADNRYLAAGRHR